jgi:hypothetical protein
MGAFNVLTAEAQCPACKRVCPQRLQFKYGDVWQYEYRPGDALKWGGNDRGQPGRKKVVVLGVSEACPQCGSSANYFEAFLEEDRIVSVGPYTGRYEFAYLEPVVIEK